MKKDILKRITCWVGIILLLLMTMFTSGYSMHTVYAAGNGNDMKKAAEVQAAVVAFKKCVTEHNNAFGNSTPAEGSFLKNNLFLGDIKSMDVGPWVANEVVHRTNGGMMTCQDNDSRIISVFVEQLGIEGGVDTLACNGDAPGLLISTSGDGECSRILNNNNFEFRWNKDGALSYLEKLYNDYLSQHPDVATFLPKWSNIDSFSPELQYYVYLNDFFTACTDSSKTTFDSSLNIPVPDTYWQTPINQINSDGTTNQSYYLKDGVKGKWGGSITGVSGANSCEGLIDLINKDYEAVRRKIEVVESADAEKKKRDCNQTMSKRAAKVEKIAKNLIKQNNENPGSVSQEKLAAASSAISYITSANGVYWRQRGDNIVCEAPSSFDILDAAGAGTTTPSNPTNPGSNDGDDDSNNDTDWSDDNFESSAPNMFNVDSCYDAADSLGWILCPLIKGVASAADGIYTLMIEPFLNVKTGSEGLKDGWSAVRNVANIGFAIMFAIVILSQLTGIGLSNYNIKKILPKLIVVAVLVNLSYVLCLLAVDVSNILGVQLHKGLADWGNAGGSGADGSPSVGWSALSTVITTLFGVGAGAALIYTAPFWIIPFLLSLVSAAISILFFFAILAVRQVAVIVLIVLAPAAIVCYALPNTKSIFNKWKSAFTSVLLVFPICGALIGGGKFASAILVTDGSVNNENFIFMLMAMLVQVIPFFMIPSLLKKSLAAIGNIGAKISAMGSKAGGFASRQLGRTRKVQDFNDSLQRNANQRRDIKLGNKLKAKENSKVKSYEDRLLAKGIDLNNAEAVKRELGSSDYREYKKLKTQDNNRRRRLAQVGHRIERMAMEDIESRVASEGELMTPQSERYQRMLTNRLSKQVGAEASALESLYASGKATKIDGQGTLDVTNMRECIEELGKIVEHLNKNPEDTDAKARMQALTTVLAKSGEPGENALRSVMLDQVHKNVQTSIDTGDKSSLMAENNIGLRAMSNFMIDRFGGQLKANDRDTFDLANALKNSDTYQENILDANGKMQPNKDFIGEVFKVEKDKNGVYRRNKTSGDMVFAPNKFDYSSASKMSEQALAGANDAQLDRIDAAIQSGDLSGQRLQDFMSLVDRTLHNENINLKLGVRSKLERMQMAAYAQNADVLQQHQKDEAVQRIQVNQNSADMLAKAENSSLDTMISQIKTTDISKMERVADKRAKMDEMRGIAANAKYALENYSLPTAKAERLQEIISSVQNNESVLRELNGVTDNNPLPANPRRLTDFAGNGSGALVGGHTLTADSQYIKLRDAKPAPQKVQTPSNWISSPNAPDGYVVNAGNGNFRNLNNAERQWLQDARSYNNRIDFENQNQQSGQNSPGSNGSNNP